MDYDDDEPISRRPRCEIHDRNMLPRCVECETQNLRDQLRHAEAEIDRLRARLDAEASHRLSLCADSERFVAEIERLRTQIKDEHVCWAKDLQRAKELRAERDRARELAVWAASKVDCSVILSNNGRKTVRLESFALGVKVIPTDGTDAGILAALEEARRTSDA